MHLHNRQIKAAFWNDPDLLQWSRDERWFYEGLTQLADDSGCLEDSSFAFKLNLYPSPTDSDITIERITEWINALVERKKLVRYTSENGKRCLFMCNFHSHQSLKNPEKPDVPLPPWIRFETYESNKRTGKYVILSDVLTDFLHGSYKVLLIEREEKEKRIEEEEKRTVNDLQNSSSSFDEFTLIARAFQDEGFGTCSPIIKDKLEMLYENFGYEWVIDAFTEAATQDKRRLSYVERILANWKHEGHVVHANKRLEVAAIKSTKTDRPGPYVPDTIPDSIIQMEALRKKMIDDAKREQS